MCGVLKKQDCLYTLIVKHPDGKVENRVIGSLVDFMMGCDDQGAVINRMASPDTKIVSLTITGGGYNVIIYQEFAIMFASPLAKSKTKAAASAIGNLPHQRSTLLAHRPSHDAFEQANMLQRSIGNQASLRLLSQRTSSLTDNQPGGDHEQEADLENMTAQEATRGVAWDFSKIPIFPPNQLSGPQTPSPFSAPPLPSIMQPKLVVGEVNDPLEHEADRVADQVLRTSDPEHSIATAPTQLSGKCAACEEEEAQALQTKLDGRPETAAGEAPGIVHQALRSPGQPLDAPTRAFFEPRFGRSFSEVRVHADANAAASARAVNALAYTAGRDIVFNQDRYMPGTSEGKGLLAHELTHMVQQAGMEPAGAVARVIQRQQPSATAQPAAAPPQVTQQLYDQACASIATKAGVNSTLLTILKKGKVSQTVRGVHSAASTVQGSIPAAPGSPGGPTSVPAVKISFDLEISPNAAQLPTGAFADFVDDPATQTSFSGQVATGQSITRLLKINTKAPPPGATAADTLGEAMVHEGTHMLLAIDNLLSSAGIPGLSAGMTGAKTAFDKYVQAAAGSSLRSALIASLVAEVNRVFTPAVAKAPTISAADANLAVANVITRLLEERFAVDQELAAYPRTVSNTTLVGAYLWDLLADETSKKPWPQGSGAQTLVTAFAAFLDNVAAILNPPPPTGSATPRPQASPPPAGSGTPQKGP